MPSMYDRLKDSNDLLDQINKGLNAYLEKKRLYFSRLVKLNSCCVIVAMWYEKIGLFFEVLILNLQIVEVDELQDSRNNGAQKLSFSYCYCTPFIRHVHATSYIKCAHQIRNSTKYSASGCCNNMVVEYFCWMQGDHNFFGKLLY